MAKTIETYQIHAYLDGELSPEECREIEARLRRDSALQQQVCELRALKSQLKTAYQALSVPPRTQANETKALKRIWSVPKTAAASLLLGMVLGAGAWNVHQGVQMPSEPQLNAQAQPLQDKYIVHLDSEDAQKQLQALQQVEALLSEGSAHRQVDFISNYDGVKMFDVNNPNRAQLNALLERFDNLTLYACQRALQRVMEKGEAFEIIPQVQHDKPAIDAVAERLNQGWQYIKI